MTPNEIQKSWSGNDGRSAPAPTGGEAGAEADLDYYLQVIRRYWWLVLGTAVLAAGVAWWLQRDEIPVYTAEALLQHRPETPVTSDVGRRLGLGSEGMQFGTQAEILRTGAVLAPVVDSLGLQLRFRTRPSDFTSLVSSASVDRNARGGLYSLAAAGDSLVVRSLPDGSLVDRAAPGEPLTGDNFHLTVSELDGLAQRPVEFLVTNREVAVNRLERQIEIEEGKGPDLLWIRYTSPDPELAASVVNSVAQSYQQHRTRTAREATQRRRKVISDQLVELADSLNKEQQNMLAYQRQQEMLDPKVQSDALLRSRIETENRLRELRYNRGVLESVVAGLQSGGADTESFRRLMAMGSDLIPGLGQMQQRLQDLQSERSRLTASRFGQTEQAPEVQVVDSLIANQREEIRVAAREALNRINSRINEAESRLSEIRGEVGSLPTQATEYQQLQQRVTAVQDVFDKLVEQYYEAQIAEGVEAGDIEVVDPAVVPLGPDPSRTRFNMLLALVAGLMVGGVGALTMDYFDSSVRTPGDAESITRLQVLGTVPRIPTSGKPESVLLGKEAFRGIRTNLRFALSDPPRTIAVTSSNPGEGKSTVAANLAVTMAEQGMNVGIVDADLRRPQVHRIFGLPRSPGMAEVLGKGRPLGDVIRPSDVPNLYVLASGGPVPSPADLLDGAEYDRLMEELQETLDVVIVDTPPLRAVTDAGVVAARMEATVLVVEANETSQEELRSATEQLRRIGARVAGVVMNSVRERDVDGRYGYSYYDDYYTGAAATRSGDEGKFMLRPPEQS